MAQKTIDFDNDILGPIGSLKEDLADLKDNKITKFYTSNNGDTVLNDSDDGKIQDLVIYGKSEQEQYKGTNLLGNVTKNTQTVFGVTVTPQVDGSFLLNGTTTKDYADIYLVGTYGTTILGTLDSTKKYFVRGSGNDNITVLFGMRGNVKSIGASGAVIDGIDYAFFYLQIPTSGTTLNNVVIYPQINEGTTLLDYEPYTGGKPSPNPEYPQEIKAVVNPVIKTHGKNLIDFRKAKGGKGDGVTFTVNADGSINMRGTATGAVGNVWFLGNYRVTEPKEEDVVITLKKGKTYYVTDCVLYSVEHGSAVSYGNVVKPINKEVKVTGIRNTNLRVGTPYNETIHPMIVESEVQIDWQPYQESQATLPYELYAIPVSSGGNVTIDGQQYIADYVDVERGKLVRMTELIEYDGTENWSLQSINNNGIANFQIIVTRYISSIGMCDTLQLQKTIISNTNTEGFMINNNNSLFIRINTTRGISTLETFKEFLANKHIFILYALSTPTEIDLVKEEITAFKALSTYYPKTYVDAESEQLEAYTMFNYPVSMEKGWEYVKQQIGDTRKYVYDMDLQSAEAYVNSEYAVALTELEV